MRSGERPRRASSAEKSVLQRQSRLRVAALLERSRQQLVVLADPLHELLVGARPGLVERLAPLVGALAQRRAAPLAQAALQPACVGAALGEQLLGRARDALARRLPVAGVLQRVDLQQQPVAIAVQRGLELVHGRAAPVDHALFQLLAPGVELRALLLGQRTRADAPRELVARVLLRQRERLLELAPAELAFRLRLEIVLQVAQLGIEALQEPVANRIEPLARARREILGPGQALLLAECGADPGGRPLAGLVEGREGIVRHLVPVAIRRRSDRAPAEPAQRAQREQAARDGGPQARTRQRPPLERVEAAAGDLRRAALAQSFEVGQAARPACGSAPRGRASGTCATPARVRSRARSPARADPGRARRARWRGSRPRSRPGTACAPSRRGRASRRRTTGRSARRRWPDRAPARG